MVLPSVAGFMLPPVAGRVSVWKYMCPTASFAVMRFNGQGVSNSWTNLRPTSSLICQEGGPPLDSAKREGANDGSRVNENQSVFDGVPNMRNMRHSMSNSLDPGNAIFCAKTSTATQPNDHMSVANP